MRGCLSLGLVARRLVGQPLVFRFSPLKIPSKLRVLTGVSGVSHQSLRGCSSRIELYEDESGSGIDAEEREEMEGMVERFLHTAAMAHQVFIIQPFVKTGAASKMAETTPELMMQESVALAETLDWKVVDSQAVGLLSFKKKYLFGSGRLDMLRERVVKDGRITAVFVSLYQLTSVQRLELEAVFGLPVIDRYSLVLQIFFQHARSKEARLQVALAELPYLRNRLSVQYEIERNSKSTGGNLGEQHFERQRFILKKIEKNIKKKIMAVKVQRDKLREGRRRNEVPTVAVIGYTNCGKTSLIKALTHSASLQPRDKLFATLDVTCHRALLSGSNLEVVFIDTVGFISDIPTPLIASFSSTLEDALHADLLIHVRDFSNPDHLHQASQVEATLRRLAVPQEAMANMLTVGNKIDLLPPAEWRAVRDEGGALPVSATENLGLDHLVSLLCPALRSCCSLVTVTMRVRPGSEEWDWLRRHGTVGSSEVCGRDDNFSLLHLHLSQANMDRFRARFVSRQPES